MLEPGIDLSLVSADQRFVTNGIDGRGWAMVIVAMSLIGVLTLRKAPVPLQPARIDHELAQEWMADALPGIGPKIRGVTLQHIHAGAIESLPARAQATAQKVFTWQPHLPSDISAPQAP